MWAAGHRHRDEQQPVTKVYPDGDAATATARPTLLIFVASRVQPNYNGERNAYAISFQRIHPKGSYPNHP